MLPLLIKKKIQYVAITFISGFFKSVGSQNGSLVDMGWGKNAYIVCCSVPRAGILLLVFSTKMSRRHKG